MKRGLILFRTEYRHRFPARFVTLADKPSYRGIAVATIVVEIVKHGPVSDRVFYPHFVCPADQISADRPEDRIQCTGRPGLIRIEHRPEVAQKEMARWVLLRK